MKQKRVIPFTISFLLVFSGLLCGGAASSVKAADTSPALSAYTSATDFANYLLGSNSGFTVSNASYTGSAANGSYVGAIGKFSGASSAVGLDSGLVLSTGYLETEDNGNIFGSGYTTDFGSSTSGNFTNATSYGFPSNDFNDASILEFDLTPTNGQAGYVSFQYCLASDEYPEYTNYADQFVLGVNGSNYALIPGTSTTVSISNINDHTNSQYYKGLAEDSDGNYITTNAISTSDFVFDGETSVFSVTAPVNAGTNHIVLAIADYGDQAVDSAVFVKAGSIKNSQAQPGALSFGGKTDAALTVNRTNGTDGAVQADVAFYDASSTKISTATVSFGDGESQKSVSIPSGAVLAKLENASGGATISSNAGTYDLTSPPLPTLSNTTVNVTEFTEITGNLASGITDGDSLTFSTVTNPSHGTLTLKSDGTYTYKPEANYTGADSFAYKAVDNYGNSTNTATVTFSISAAAENPDKSAVATVPFATGGSSTTATITPSIVGGLSGGDNVNVVLDRLSANIPVTVLTRLMGDDLSSTLKLSKDETSAGTKSKVFTLIQGNGNVADMFDIDLTRYYSNGTSEAVHELNGKIKITISLTDAMLASINNAETAKLYCYDTSTGKLVDMNATFDLTNKTVTFYTDHFSTYLIENAGVKNPNTGDASNNVLPVVILSGLSALAAFLYMGAASNKKIHQK